MTKNAKASTSFRVIASNLVRRPLSSVEYDSIDRILLFVFFQEIYMVESLSTLCRASTKHISRQKTNIKILSLESNSTLLRGSQTKFEAIMLKDVEALAFLAKAVRRKRFQIKEGTAFDS